MWTSTVRASIAFAALGFMMWVLAQIVAPIVDIATTGPNANADSVATAGQWFNALSVSNLTLLAGLAVAIYWVGRAVVERRASP